MKNLKFIKAVFIVLTISTMAYTVSQAYLNAPTVQQKNYAEWLGSIEQSLWEGELPKETISIRIKTGSEQYSCCASNDVDTYRERLIRILSLLRVSDAMREPVSNNSADKPEIKVLQGDKVLFAARLSSIRKRSRKTLLQLMEIYNSKDVVS